MLENDRQRLAAIAGGEEQLTPRHHALYGYFQKLQHKVVTGPMELTLLLVIHQQATMSATAGLAPLPPGEEPPVLKTRQGEIDADTYSEADLAGPDIDWKTVKKGTPIYIDVGNGQVLKGTYLHRQGRAQLRVEMEGRKEYVSAEACRLAS